jgi:hypothetical protein
MGEDRNVYKVLVGKPEGNRPLEKTRRRWEGGIRTDPKEIGWGLWIGVNWLKKGNGARYCEYCDKHSGSGVTVRHIHSKHFITRTSI